MTDDQQLTNNTNNHQPAVAEPEQPQELPSPSSERSSLLPAIKTGIIGSVAVWHVCLVGMFETFAERSLIGETITMGYIMLVALTLLVSYLAANQAQRPLQHILRGILAGGIVGLSLTLLAYLTYAIELDNVFSFASPRLGELLTMEQGEQQKLSGLLIPTGSGIGLGILGGILATLPALWRRTITISLIMTILLALLRDVIAVLLPNDIRKFFFTSTGLTNTGATIILIVTAAFAWAQSYFRLRPRRSTLTTTTLGKQTHSWQWWAGMAFLAIFLLTFPLWSKSFLSNVAVLVGLYIIMGMGLNLVIGFAGMLDLGFVAFYAIGAYTMAVLTSPDLGFFDFTFWQALPFSMIFAMIGGTILALPILKMRGDYLAIATLGFGEIIRILALSDFLKPYMGGAQGITRIARPEFGELIIKDPQQFYYLILVGCVVAWYVGSNLKRSRLGRAWMAIREDEDVAQAMGINRVMVKLSAFVIGAFLGGLSGGMFAGFVGSVVPKSFELLISINVLALIIVGGMGSLPGVIVGAIAMVGLPELLREFREYRMLVYGAVVVLMMLYRPQGLWPEAVVAREMQEKEEAEAKEKENDQEEVAASATAPSAES